MKTLWLAGIIVFVVHDESFARGWEVSLLAGWTAPTFDQTFRYDAGIDISPPFPGVSIEQQGEFQLKARGNFALGGGLTYYFNDSIGIEGRIDTADIKIDTIAPSFVASVAIPGLPPLGAEFDFGTGNVDVERLFPLSLNLKARTGGDTRFVASGGFSYLPRMRFTATQTIGLGVTGILGGLEVAQADIRAVGAADNEGQLGFNAGVGVEVQLSDGISFVAEARAFLFQSRTFEWRLPSNPDSLERSLQEDVLTELPPIDFSPAYYHVTGGLVFRIR